MNALDELTDGIEALRVALLEAQEALDRIDATASDLEFEMDALES